MQNLADRKDFYKHSSPENDERTRSRLNRIQHIGMSEIGVAEFGIHGLMSGLYIEKVWNYSDRDFDSYLNWVKELKNTE